MTATDNAVYMTDKGIRKVRAELETLLETTRPELLGFLQDARDGGDSADNTEYLFLIQELEDIDRRIKELEFKLEHVQLIEQAGTKEAITLGSRVIVQENGAAPETYMIVGSVEADPEQGSISNESPLGKALMNHRVGDEIAVDAPDGHLLFRVIDIN
jgi:transcription elongation factor GreA